MLTVYRDEFDKLKEDQVVLCVKKFIQIFTYYHKLIVSVDGVATIYGRDCSTTASILLRWPRYMAEHITTNSI